MFSFSVFLSSSGASCCATGAAQGRHGWSGKQVTPTPDSSPLDHVMGLQKPKGPLQLQHSVSGSLSPNTGHQLPLTSFLRRKFFKTRPGRGQLCPVTEACKVGRAEQASGHSHASPSQPWAVADVEREAVMLGKVRTLTHSSTSTASLQFSPH